MSNKFDNEKKMIGYLLNHYFKISRLSISEFISGDDEYFQTTCITCKKCIKPERICSKNTLYRLFDGSIVTNECIYFRLASKLGKEIILDRYDIYDKLEKYKTLLYENLVDLNATNLERLESLIAIEIKKYKNVLYVYEILSLYLNIIKDKLYPGYCPEKEDVQTYLFLKDNIDEVNKKLILYYFYTGMFRRGDYKIDLNLIYQESKKYFDDSLMYDIKLDSLYELDLLHAYIALTSNELPKLHSLSNYHQYKLFKTLSNIQVNLEIYDDAYTSILKSYEVIEKSDFGKMTLFACYLRLGFVSYCLKKYDQTMNWFLKALQIKKNLAKDFIFLCKSMEKLEKIEELRNILTIIDVKLMKAPYGKKVYYYYSMKYRKDILTKKDIVELENYICDILKPYFDTYGQIHKDAFNEDLKEYVKITGNYKKYYDFNS